MKLNRRNITFAGGLAAGAAVMSVATGLQAYACTDDDLKKAVEEFRQAMVDGNGARLLELSADALSFGHANGTRIVPRWLHFSYSFGYCCTSQESCNGEAPLRMLAFSAA